MREYEVHISKTRYPEFIRLAYPNTLGAVIFWPFVKLGVIRWQPQLIPRHDSVGETITQLDQLPASIREDLSERITQLSDFGFIEPLIQVQTSLASDGQNILGVCLICRHEDGQYILQTPMSWHPSGVHQSQEQLVTFLDEDRTLATTNGRRKYDPIPGSAPTYHPQVTLERLIAMHEEKLNQLVSPPLRMTSREELLHQLDAASNRFFDHMIARGIFQEKK
jgi:hypothetical protein